VASTQFLTERPDLVKAFLSAHVDAVTFIRTQAAQAKALSNKEIERVTTKTLPAKVIDAAFKNVDFTYEPLTQTLLRQADFAFDLGFLGSSKPDLSGIYDLTLLNEVLKSKKLPTV